MRQRGAGDRTWWVACGLLFATAFGTNVPTPLLLVYRTELDLAPCTLAAIFGVYALGLAPSLLLGGPASDRFGRVRVLLPASVGVVLGSLLFLGGASALWLLFAARFVQGLASGAVFSVGSAWLQDRAGADGAGRAARAASVAQTAGFCLGPLASGLLAAYGPLPLTLPYLVHVGLLVVAVAAVLVTVGTGSPPVGVVPRGLLPRPGFDPAARRTFVRVVVPTAVCVYAFPSVSVTVLPLLLPGASGLVAFTGLLAALTLGTGTLVQPFAHRPGARAGALGAALGALGFATGVVAALTGSVVAVAVAGILLGAGGGLCLNAGLTLVGRLAPASGRGAANGVFYTAAYLGFATPFLVTASAPVQALAVPLAVLVAVTVATAAWLAARAGDTAS
ncbi:MFS transporter [Pseudonocardia sp. Ae150A_Ps1]|uniref:MFS transporter n=1 Tax=Pseudonocardia sp. Ae150A_Ps1 TaxID=1885028 RepID=UPI000967F111|nr:MFS transporter [Pseudonocardia sp. Ae150A_Ps1]OLL76046.1 putative multidrug resistance transporter, MFS superfamily [Pseudonocardia sp. Ae150A_Ps1]